MFTKEVISQNRSADFIKIFAKCKDKLSKSLYRIENNTNLP